MIRKLTDADETGLLNYLAKDPAYNLFIISDIENFGFDKSFQDVWADFDRNGAIKAVLLRYFGHFILSLASENSSFDREGFLRIVKDHTEFNLLSGREEIIDSLSGDVAARGIHRLYFASLSEVADGHFPSNGSEPEKAGPEDAEELFALHETIPEFDDLGETLESFRKALETGTGRTFFLRENGAIVSSASTTAENSFGAMVVGVCTADGFRKRGLATACMASLCREICQEGKKAYLFYNNPAAASIYKRLGFKDIGRWASAYP